MSGERLLASNPNDVVGAQFRARMHHLLSAIEDQDVMDRAVADDMGPIQFSMLARGTPGGLLFYAASTPRAMVILVSGAETAHQGLLMASDYYGSISNFIFQSPAAHLTLNDWARQIGTRVSVLPEAIEVLMSGYSAGGALLGYLRNNLILDRPNAFFQGVSFGAPCSRTNRLDDPWAGRNFVRWFLSDDPVPTIPSFDPWKFRWYGSCTFSQVNRMETFRHDGVGVEVGLTGSLRRDAGIPQFPGEYPQDPIQRWLDAAQQRRQSPHSIEVYEARLSLALPITPASQRVAASTGMPPNPPVTLERDFRRRSTEQSSTIFHDAARLVGVQPVIPDDRLFKAGRVGKTWFVYFGGVAISAAPHKKRARGLARAGNDWLRRLQLETKVDTTGLLEQFTEYLNLASNPDTGFFPQLNHAP
jgi:hypothetical protein